MVMIMDLFSLIGIDYSFYTLACAVIFPVASAFVVFGALHRVGTVKKILSYFIPMPIYVSLCIFLLCEPHEVIIPALERAGLELSLSQPEVIGFLASLAFGILYFGIVELICGAKVMKRGLCAMSAVCTLIFTAFEGFIAYMAHAVVPSPVNTPAAPPLDKLFEKFELPYSSDVGLDIIAVAAAVIYIILGFLALIGVRAPLVGEARSANGANARGGYNAAIEPCCAFCQYARQLKDDEDNVLCDKTGVVNGAHRCRRFVYDPLKRRPVRIHAQSAELESTPDADMDKHE